MRLSDSNFRLAIVWLAIASSSVVFFEPAPSDLLVILATGLFFIQGLRTPKGIGIPILFLSIYLICNLIAASTALEPMTTLKFASVRFYMAISFLLFTSLIYENPKKVLPVIWSAYIVATLITITGGIIGYYEIGGPSEQLIENGRARAFFKDPNVYGPFIVPTAVYALARLETASRKEAFGYSLLLAFCTFGILLGYSRGAYINFIASTGIFFLIRIASQRNYARRQRIIWIGLGMLVGGVALVGAAASTDKVQEMLEKRMKVVQYYDAGEGGRMTRQLDVVKEILVNPFGIGPGESIKTYYFSNAPHNLYLHVTVETGWVGGFGFFAFILLTLWRGARYFRKATNVNGITIAVYASIIGVLIQSLFIDSTHWRHFFLIIAMVWGPVLAWENSVQQVTKKIVRPAASRKLNPA